MRRPTLGSLRGGCRKGPVGADPHVPTGRRAFGHMIDRPTIRLTAFGLDHPDAAT
ncbi:hypothetical protein HH310_31660 [Actinoplanes sp. TBRC 11911]|uniref:hypothetical protein n=1 Tax=Actinoplanes sp. TBRC 11911 TaxID=2729386 RepID=UPI00145DBEF5|nr:hypothetical protein [Actinoplanes sp. TBRC 11911]NMO55727.1 hypothetical protein [Actinoplanes sp. TBRC 11911]